MYTCEKYRALVPLRCSVCEPLRVPLKCSPGPQPDRRFLGNGHHGPAADGPVTAAPVSSLPSPAQALRPAGDAEVAAVSEGAAAPVLGRQGPARNRADACLKPVEADLLLIFGCQAKEEEG